MLNSAPNKKDTFANFGRFSHLFIDGKSRWGAPKRRGNQIASDDSLRLKVAKRAVSTSAL